MKNLEEVSNNIRAEVLKMTTNAKSVAIFDLETSSRIGSIADIKSIYDIDSQH